MILLIDLILDFTIKRLITINDPGVLPKFGEIMVGEINGEEKFVGDLRIGELLGDI